MSVEELLKLRDDVGKVLSQNHLRPAFAVAPSDAYVEAAIAAVHLALTDTPNC